MMKTVQIVAVQMDAAPAPARVRLCQAEALAVRAVEAGAELIVLPEVFNTGYAYSSVNYSAAESIQGETVAWMRETASRLGIHLAGSLMLFENGEIFNALILFAPDGRYWRYDKRYPWGWERAYFRSGKTESIANTDIGDIGLMICWDIGHRKLWRSFAGRVDFVLTVSCPPDVTNTIYICPDGVRFGLKDLGPAARSMIGSAPLAFGQMFCQQAAWLGVPAVNSGASGILNSPVPTGAGTFLPFYPSLVKFLKLPREQQVAMTCGFIPACKILDANGEVLGELSPQQGENFVLSEVTLAEKKPFPLFRQPRSPMPVLSYLLSDVLLPWASIPLYEEGISRISLNT